MLAAALGIILLGVAFLLSDSGIIGYYFVFIGTITIPYVIIRFRYKLPIIEINELQVRITYNGQRLKLQWSDIQNCELKHGMQRNGYVPVFLVIRLRSGVMRQISLPALTVDKEEIVRLINRGAANMGFEKAGPMNMR